MAFTQVTVTGTYQRSDGTPATGYVSFTPVAPMRNTTASTEQNTVTTVTGTVTAGALGPVSLAATTDPGTIPAGNTYRVVEHLQGQHNRRPYFIEIPAAGGSINLDTHPRSGEAAVTAANFYADRQHTHTADDITGLPPGGEADASRQVAYALMLGGH